MRPALQPRPDELDGLRRRVDAVARELEDVRARLETLDGEVRGAAALPSGGRAEDGPTAAPGAGELLPLVGRAFLALGGAFLVRALTDAAVLPPGPGVMCGYAYAMGCAAWAGVEGRRGNRRQALADGLAAAVIVYPLLWEAVRRFSVLSPPESAAALALAAHALLGAAVAARLPALAWLAVTGAAATGAGLFLVTHALVPFTLGALLLAFSTTATARARQWTGLSWPPIAAAALLIAAGVVVAGNPHGIPESFAGLEPWHVVLLALGLPAAALLASLTVRAQPGSPLTGVGEMAVALVVGYGGALRVAGAAAGAALPAVALAGLGAAAAALAWAEVARSRRPARADAATALALLVFIAASASLVAGPGRVAAWSLSGALLCAFGRSGPVRWMGAAVLALASLQAAVPRAILHTFGGGTGAAPLLLMATVLAATMAARHVAGRRRRPGDEVGALPEVLGVLALLPLAVLVAAALAAAIDGDAARRSMAATVVLALAAPALAVRARAGRPFAPRWVAHALLALAGLKLVVFDLRHGNPATLFVTFVVYGGALILAPRLLRARDAKS